MGVDVGSVSLKVVLMEKNGKILKAVYERTNGQPVEKIKEVFKKISRKYIITGVGITGSARIFIGKIIGADVVKNEITAHASALKKLYPQAKTVIEIGGQDSKIIIFRNGIPVDFAMNTVCAAGTGSFLDQQASRLNIPIEKFGKLAVKSKKDLNLGGRCTVFAESDMIQKQQAGHEIKDIISGLCTNLVKNYINNVAKGKELEKPFVLIGGVAANKGIVKAFEKELGSKMIIPKYYNVIGAIGMAFLVLDENVKDTKFKSLNFEKYKLKRSVFKCKDCENNCDIVKVKMGKETIHIGSKCGKFE
jgi:predicted CoA-substrate-specific enzyme activase